MDSGDGRLSYLPVTCKYKLNKKRKATSAYDEDKTSQVKNIVIAARGYTLEEKQQIRSSTVFFNSKDDLFNCERNVATELKGLFA